MTYQLIRSNRRTIALEVRRDGLLVRAPYAATQAQIDAFVNSKAQWIARAQEKIAAEPAPVDVGNRLTEAELRALAEQALQVIPQRVAFYAAKLGVTYGRITIRNQRSRWGSCSAKGNLNFNCLLMLAPPEALDAVIVHALCHRREMNHSKAFYALVFSAYPDYFKWDQWLKDNGEALMRRMTG